MALDSTDWERINGCLVRLYRELDPEKHARVMLHVLNELVPGQSTVLNYFKPPHQLNCVTLPEKLATDEQVATVGRYGYQSPFGAYYLATQDASWKMTTDFMPVEEFHKLEIHRLALGPLGINQQMGGILAVVDDVYHLVTIHRTYEGFTERERELLNTLHPHLVTSYLNAKFVSRADRSLRQLKAAMETAPGAYGYFNQDGSLAWMQPKAQEWLREFFPAETTSNGTVPRQVSAMVRASAEESGTPKSLTESGATEFLSVFLSESALGGWILRLERKPRKNPPRFRPLTQLTPAENAALRWMAEGKRNGEIATILNISSRTVEKHVQGILAKFGVENRATAIIRAMELAAQQAQ